MSGRDPWPYAPGAQRTPATALPWLRTVLGPGAELHGTDIMSTIHLFLRILVLVGAMSDQ